MKVVRNSRLLRFSGLILCVMVWLANSGNPPTGRTGAPFDSSTCGACHNGGNFNGEVSIEGLPGTIQSNQVYPLTLTMNVTSGNPTEGGFQLVVVDANNGNAGNLANVDNQVGTEFFGGREYAEQRGGKAISGGTVSWNFNWTSPVTVPGNQVKFYYIGNFTNNNNLSSGDFTVTANVSVPFSGPPPVTATITNTTNVLCFGGNTGSATVEGDGGVPPYTYLWSNGQTTATATNLPVGTYTATVTGSGGSGTATASTTITQPSAVNLTATTPGVLNCAVGEVTSTATATGGISPYEYFWSNGQTGATATFNAPGAYNVTASDANGCTKVLAVNVTENVVQPTVAASSNGDITCTTNQVTLSGNGSSQGPNFTYLWTTTDGNIVSGGTTLTPTVNDCGTYILTVTNTTNGCSNSASTMVECFIDPPNISVNNTGPLTCTVQNVELQGNSTVPDVDFYWTGPNGFISTDQNPVVSAPGSYTLVVTNSANSCTNSAVTVVAQNVIPPTDTTHVSGQITCTDPEVRIFMTTNIQNATFQWTGPNGFTSTQRMDTIAVPGDYIGVVTNPANGCKSRDTITVVQNTTPPGASASASGPITCLNASVQLTGEPSGMNTYQWTGPNNFTSNVQNPVVNAAGPYQLVVTSSANGCSSSASVAVVQNTTPPVASIAPPGNLNCNNQTLQLNGTGSSQGVNFDYQWSTTNGEIISGDTSLVPVIGAPGTYLLAVTNTSNGCTASASTVVLESPAVTLSTSNTPVSCFGGSDGVASATGSGGSGAFSYLWSTGATTSTISGLTAGTYIVSVTDAENCTASATVVVAQPSALSANATATGETALGANDGTASAAPTGGTPTYAYSWNTGATTAQITGLAPGSYTVSVTDANGCTSVQVVTVNAFGCTLTATITSEDVSCNGVNDGTASVAVSGAADPVAYNWSNGETTPSVANLAPGTYTVSVVDGNNCPAVLTTIINEPSAVAPNATATGETGSGANDGTATASPTGGAGGYTYLWSNSGATATITNLAPGTYTVSVTDDNGCTGIQTVNVNSFNCAVSAAVTLGNVSCFGGADGQATVVLSGGQLPYSYLWSNGAITATVTNLAAGSYTVTAADGAGCTVVETATIGQPAALAVEVIAIQNVVCPTSPTGSANIDVSGGTAPYLISGNLTNLPAGQYSVVVTDFNQCSATATFSISATDATPPTINCPANIYVCGADFVTYPAATASDDCGLSGNPVLISGQTSGSAFNDGTTTQVFRATDLAGNTSTCSFSVVVYPIPDIFFDGATNDNNGLGVGTISITAVGGGGNYVYTWNRNGQFFSNNEDLTGLNAGSYTLTISDGNGCTSALSPIVINNTVGTDAPGELGSVRLWPNPATSNIQLELMDIDVQHAVILDTRGRLVKELNPLWLQNEISVAELSSGMYFLRITTTQGKILSLRFMKSS